MRHDLCCDPTANDHSPGLVYNEGRHLETDREPGGVAHINSMESMEEAWKAMGNGLM